jgi:hypothetical protein
VTFSMWIRQIHRWLSVAFATVVLGIFIALGMGKPPTVWVYYVPLFPLALLMLTGSYMFVLPYTRSGRGVDLR